jgi:hypothetical protein
MRVRKLSPTGDYTFGQGTANFYINSPLGVAQNVKTTLQLWEGEWFLDNTLGTPWSQEVLGYNNVSLRDMIVKAAILGVFGVVSIDNYNSTVVTSTRQFIVQGSIITIYDPAPIPFGPVIL